MQFLICRVCGQVTELEDCGVCHALEGAARARGFQPSSTIVELEGTCGACAQAA